MNTVVRVVQEHDAVGVQAPMTFVEQIRQAKSLQTWPDATMQFIRELNPSRTGQQGVYAYRDPDRGSGLLIVEGANPLQLLRIDELVHMEEIERAIGMKDPTRIEDIPAYLIPFVVRTRNPYIHLLLAGLILVASILTGSMPFLRLEEPPISLTALMIVLGALGLALSGILGRRVWRRLPWWHAARAQAKRDGGPMPEDLQILG